jgi:hypothetical protein
MNETDKRTYGAGIQQLAVRALGISISAPLDVNPAWQVVTVEAHVVRDIRLIAEAMGIDWRELHAKARA